MQIEGLQTPEEMLNILQRVVEESSTSLVAARLEAEERRNNMRLREEQDAAYSAALEADRVFFLPGLDFSCCFVCSDILLYSLNRRQRNVQ